MTQPFLSQINVFPYNFAPRNYALCAGQLLPISQNTALFSLLGTNFGGNGTTNFALPSLGSQAAVGRGDGPGLTPRTIGEQFGSELVTLLSTEMPAHNHGFVLYAQNNPAKRTGTPTAGNALSAPSSAASTAFLPAGVPNTTFSPQMAQIAGGSQPHTNQQPYLGLLYCIALQGVFPARN